MESRVRALRRATPFIWAHVNMRPHVPGLLHWPHNFRAPTIHGPYNKTWANPLKSGLSHTRHLPILGSSMPGLLQSCALPAPRAHPWRCVSPYQASPNPGLHPYQAYSNRGQHQPLGFAPKDGLLHTRLLPILGSTHTRPTTILGPTIHRLTLHSTGRSPKNVRPIFATKLAKNAKMGPTFFGGLNEKSECIFKQKI